MAKIISVTLGAIPEEIILNDLTSDIKVLTKIEYHDLDLQFDMEYCLQLFVYDVRGSLDTPVIISNWDESQVIPVSQDRKDHLLGKAVVMLSADKKNNVIETAMALKLGHKSEGSSSISRKLEIFATIAPAVGRSSKWSDPFESQLLN